MKTRRHVKRKMKKIIWTRDKNLCCYCHTFLKEGERTVEHVIPLSEGGGNNSENLATACRPCNLERSKKGNVIIY